MPEVWEPPVSCHIPLHDRQADRITPVSGKLTFQIQISQLSLVNHSSTISCLSSKEVPAYAYPESVIT